jgi:hypothetical protein
LKLFIPKGRSCTRFGLLASGKGWFPSKMPYCLIIFEPKT